MTTLMQLREAKVERHVRDSLRMVAMFDPDLYDYALRIAGKVIEERQAEENQRAMERRLRLNGRVSRYAE